MIKIKEETVEIAMIYKNKEYLLSKGYSEVKSGTKITIKIEDLPKGSHIKVTGICPDCNDEKIQEYRDIVKKGNTYCQKCAKNHTKRESKYLGTQKGDYVAIEILDASKLVVQCVVCGRKHVKFKSRFNSSSNSHKQCGMNLGMKNTGFYGSWVNMRTRTTNPNYEKWDSYGGRGISSEEFKYFVDFYDNMYDSYLEHVKIYGEANTTLERIDVNGDYTKENCTWVTWDEQAKNKTNILKFIAISPSGDIYEGENLKEFCECHNLNYKVIISGIHQHKGQRFRNGWKFTVV